MDAAGGLPPGGAGARAHPQAATVLAGASHDALRIGLQQKISEMESMELEFIPVKKDT